MSFLLAIDLGTTGCRSIVFDSSLNMLGSYYKEYGLNVLDSKRIEQDAGLWWALAKESIKGAAESSSIDPRAISGISISSQGISFVPVDRDISPLYPSINWLDTRADKQADSIARSLGTDGMFMLTGKRVSPAYTLPKLLWLKENEPGVFSRTYKFLMPHDFILAKLTGKCYTDHTMASGTLMYDIKKQRWSKTILERFGIGMELLPDIAWSGSAAGNILPDVAEELGLDSRCVAAVGGQDQKCAALGVGIRPDTVTISLGTSAAVTKIWESPPDGASQDIGWSSFMLEGAWETEGVVKLRRALPEMAEGHLLPVEQL
jgi:xylulokinase